MPQSTQQVSAGEYRERIRVQRRERDNESKRFDLLGFRNVGYRFRLPGPEGAAQASPDASCYDQAMDSDAFHALANDTFATPEEAFDWERRPHPLLGGKTPLEYATSAAGADRVRDILVAIKHGIVT